MRAGVRTAAVALGLLAAGTAALAQAPRTEPEEYAFCPANPRLAPPPASVPLGPVPIVFDAAQGTARRDGLSHFSGNVVVTRGRERLWADQVEYQSSTGVASGSGNLRYANPKLSLTAQSGTYDFKDDRGNFFGDVYQLPDLHGRGTASRIATFASDRSELYGLLYTTCPQGKRAWGLHAKRIVLNHDQEIGYAHDAWLTFKGVPFLWTPYLSFPLTDRRKSGFLAPSLAQSNGLDLEVPYYWNIAPNMDMTFTPRLLTQRGVMWMDSYRYLLPGTRGLLDAEYLPHDRQTDSTRGLFRYDDSTQLFSNWHFDTALEYVSDPYYLQDFGTDLQRVSQSYQTRRVTATYQVPSGSAFITMEDLAPLDPSITAAERPYRKLPEIGFDFSWPDYRTGLDVGLRNDYTRFEAPARLDAKREDLMPSIAENLGGGAWYLTPKLRYEATHYGIDSFDGNPGYTLNRTAPIFTLDSGLTFERTLGKNGWLTQTLEPRAYYLYVPYRDQSNIPIFDTYQPPLTMDQLFSTNRFVGLDRLGDANQISLGLTSRFIDDRTGNQLFSLALGQAFYFRNRDVTLPGQAPETTARSDYVGEATANLGHHIYASITGDYNPYAHDFDQGYVALQYQPGTYKLVNLGYLYRQGQLDQTNISFAWPIAGNWSAVGRWNYSILDHQTVEVMAGLQYDSCCWRFRIVQRRFATLNGQGSYALYLELQLKGLGSLGNRLSDFLHDEIYGYGNSPQ